MDPSIIIEDFLYLSSYRFASNSENIKKYNIGVIINVAKEINYEIGSFGDVSYHKFEIDDDIDEQIEDHFGIRFFAYFSAVFPRYCFNLNLKPLCDLSQVWCGGIYCPNLTGVRPIFVSFRGFSQRSILLLSFRTCF